MGLDMYLEKRIYVGAYFDHRNVECDISLSVNGEDISINTDKVGTIVERAGYWRKANHIHRWFVENVQDGEDDCGEYWVSKENIEKLLATVNTVLEHTELTDGKVLTSISYSKGERTENWEDGEVVRDPSVAKNLLPVQEGFFFGNTHYDEWYYIQLEDTKEILEEALQYVGQSGIDYYYQSSW